MVSPAYYNDVVRAPSSFSWKYFLAFNLLGSIVLGVIVGVPLSLVNVSGLIEQTSSVYPADLEITADQHGISVNQELPYSVPIPLQWDEELDVKAELREEQVPLNLVTFVSQEEATLGARIVENYDSFAVITPNTIYVREDQDTNQIRAYALPEVKEPVTITRGVIDGWVNRVADHPFFRNRLYAPALALFVILFSYPFMLLWKIITLAFYSAIVWLISMITMKDKQLGYGKVFQIGLHSMTLISVLAIVVNVLSLFTLGGVFFLLAFVIWSLFLIAQLTTQAVAQVATTDSGATLMRSASRPPSARRTPALKSARRTKRK